MTLLESIASFSIAACLLTLTPGLDTALVLRQLITKDAHAARKAAFGVAAGCLIWGALVALGLGMLLASSVLAFTLVKSLGAVYLIWQGFLMLRRSAVVETLLSDVPVTEKSSSDHAAFFQGFWTNVLNPKIGIFYITLLPQFLVTGFNAGFYIFSLAFIHVLFSVIWFMLLIKAGQKSISLLKNPVVSDWTNKVTGAMLIVFGLKLGVSEIN
jgi:threonine/homoserine/homoserine lactone efflux protein